MDLNRLKPVIWRQRTAKVPDLPQWHRSDRPTHCACPRWLALVVAASQEMLSIDSQPRRGRMTRRAAPLRNLEKRRSGLPSGERPWGPPAPWRVAGLRAVLPLRVSDCSEGLRRGPSGLTVARVIRATCPAHLPAPIRAPWRHRREQTRWRASWLDAPARDRRCGVRCPAEIRRTSAAEVMSLQRSPVAPPWAG
jgi:hypothetical protein